MQENKKVYPSERKPGKWLSYLLLFLSAVIVFSGLAGRGKDAPVIEAAATPTPIPLEEAFDETVESRDIQLPGTVWYALQLGAFQDQTEAEKLGEQYQRRGAAGYVWQDGRYRTLAALYPSKEDAQNVRQQLLSQHNIESNLYEISLQELTLRMKGMKGQIDVLEAAFQDAEELIAQLQGYSVKMDRQELNPEEAYAALQSLGDRARLISARLRQRFQAPRNAAVEGLIALFEDFEAFRAGQDEKESAVVWSRQMKYQSIRTLELLKQIFDGLGNT